MPIQQDQLAAVNTSITFETINNSKADRILHNGTDIIKCEFTSPKPSSAYYIGTNNITGTLLPKSEYIDELYVALTPVSANYFEVAFDTVISTREIKIYSTTFIANVPSAGTIDVYKAFTQDGFIQATGGIVSYTFRTDLSPQQYEYKVTFTSDQSARFWKFRFQNAGTTIVASSITEVIVKDRPAPKIKYYQTNGTESVSYTMEKSNILDLCYDYVNNKYYTIRFNDDLVGSGLDPDDDFTTESGTTNFSPIRWTEDLNRASFFRSVSTNKLIFSTTSGEGRLQSNYKLEGNCEFEIDYDITTFSGNQSYFGLHALDSDTDNIKYGIGVHSGTGGQSYYKVAMTSYLNTTTSAELLQIRPALGVLTSGTETWTVIYNSSFDYWSVSGSTVGLQANATTGQLYSNNYISFQISATETQVNNDSFIFILSYEEDTRSTTSGTINIARSTSSFSSSNSVNFNETIDSNDLEVEIYGKTNVTINITADNYEVVTGTYTYPDVAVFTIERVNAQGVVQQTIVEKFNVIKDPTKTYNNYLDGAVQITVNPSQIMFAKILDQVYRFSVASPIAGLVDEDTVGVDVSLPGVIPDTQAYGFTYSDSSGGFLFYIDYDGNTLEVRGNTLTAANPPTPQTRKVFFHIPDWNEQSTNLTPYQLFLHGIDPDTTFYLRKHGTNGLNSNKLSSTAGVANATTVFTDSSQNYTTSKVKKGDLVIILEGSYAGNGTYVVNNVNSTTSITLDRVVSPAQASIDYRIVSNAEMLQFNTEPAVSAFSSVNVEDFSLRAGTSELTNVNVDVINAWGEPLSGKTVTFSVIQGDGVVNPPSSSTNVSGVATSQYTVGTTAGPVQIQVSISD